jgi:hypothetical protein
MNMNLKKAIIKRLGKKRMNMVQEIGLDTEAVDVVLFEGLINTEYDETIFVWGLHRFDDEGVTQKTMLDELISWFDSVKAK